LVLIDIKYDDFLKTGIPAQRNQIYVTLHLFKNDRRKKCRVSYMNVILEKNGLIWFT